MKFAESLKQLRKERNITQRALADAVGISPASIAMYETGGRVPSFEAAETIAEHLGVTLASMVEGGPMPEPAASEEGVQRAVKIRVGKTTILIAGSEVMIVEYNKEGSIGSFTI